jgi:GxxExxY protein
MDKEGLDKLGAIILDSCINVHRELGPGLLESAYTTALVAELRSRDIRVDQFLPIELNYKGTPLGKVYVIDILVANEIILEIKSVESIDRIFIAQLITYLKITEKKLGYLINFNSVLLKDGFRRIVNRI